MKLTVPLHGMTYNPGDRVENKPEEELQDVRFDIHKFTNRPRPDKSKVVIIPAFSEFGCESLIPLYCLPILLQTKYRGYYSIVMGWYGREYFYRHLVDEYWELHEEFQCFREYCRAFHHESNNIKKVEQQAAEFGKVLTSADIGNIATYPRFLTCVVDRSGKLCGGRVSQFKDFQQCQKCGFSYQPTGLFSDCNKARKTARWLPSLSPEKLEVAKSRLPPNAVGVTGRGRKCYGRNLTPEFYERLIWLLEDMGYNPVWLGEKATTLSCPCPRITDFRGDSEVRDFEQTLAYVSEMKFTIQFWTASTRLAGLVGTPFILFESPDQIWGGGQEGYRLHLASKGPKKLVIAHFRSVLENNTKALKIVESSIRNIEVGDYSTVFGMVEDERCVRAMMRSSKNNITWF